MKTLSNEIDQISYFLLYNTMWLQIEPPPNTIYSNRVDCACIVSATSNKLICASPKIKNKKSRLQNGRANFKKVYCIIICEAITNKKITPP